MSILDTIDELSSDVPTELVIQEEISGAISTESIGDVTAHFYGDRGQTKHARLIPEMLDRAVVQKFDDLYRRCVLRKSLEKVDKVDKALALEAMAGMPIATPLTKAKLTEAPSAINKTILDTVIFTEQEELPMELHQFIMEVLNPLRDGGLDELKTEHSGLLDILKETVAKVELKEGKTVIFHKEGSIDLIGSDIDEVECRLRHIKQDPGSDKRLSEYALLLYPIVEKINWSFSTWKLKELHPEKFKEDIKSIGYFARLTLDVISSLAADLEVLRNFTEVASEYDASNSRAISVDNPLPNKVVSLLQPAVTAYENYNTVMGTFDGDREFIHNLKKFADLVE